MWPVRGWIPCRIIKANNDKDNCKADHDSKGNENINAYYKNNDITFHSKGMSSTE